MAWSLLYIVAGAGAIVALTAYLILDAIQVARHRIEQWPRRWAAVGATLVVLWLTAAVLRP